MRSDLQHALIDPCVESWLTHNMVHAQDTVAFAVFVVLVVLLVTLVMVEGP